MDDDMNDLLQKYELESKQIKKELPLIYSKFIEFLQKTNNNSTIKQLKKSTSANDAIKHLQSGKLNLDTSIYDYFVSLDYNEQKKFVERINEIPYVSDPRDIRSLISNLQKYIENIILLNKPLTDNNLEEKQNEIKSILTQIENMYSYKKNIDNKLTEEYINMFNIDKIRSDIIELFKNKTATEKDYIDFINNLNIKMFNIKSGNLRPQLLNPPVNKNKCENNNKDLCIKLCIESGSYRFIRELSRGKEGIVFVVENKEGQQFAAKYTVAIETDTDTRPSSKDMVGKIHFPLHEVFLLQKIKHVQYENANTQKKYNLFPTIYDYWQCEVDEKPYLVIITELYSGSLYKYKIDNKKQKRDISGAIIGIMGKLIELGLYYADWHPGNLLYRTDVNGDLDIALTDLSGVFEKYSQDDLEDTAKFYKKEYVSLFNELDKKTFGGIYMEKYIKYKQKYLALKNKFL